MDEIKIEELKSIYFQEKQKGFEILSDLDVYDVNPLEISALLETDDGQERVNIYISDGCIDSSQHEDFCGSLDGNSEHYEKLGEDLEKLGLVKLECKAGQKVYRIINFERLKYFLDVISE